jgi:hypothetical protein
VQIAAGGSNGTVTQRRLDEVDWRSLVERVGSVRVAQPVRAYVGGNARAQLASFTIRAIRERPSGLPVRTRILALRGPL